MCEDGLNTWLDHSMQYHSVFFRRVETQVCKCSPKIENDSDDSLNVAHELIQKKVNRKTKDFRQGVNEQKE